VYNVWKTTQKQKNSVDNTNGYQHIQSKNNTKKRYTHTIQIPCTVHLCMYVPKKHDNNAQI